MTTRTFLAGATLALCLPLFTSAATLVELQQQLQSLLAQIALLQKGQQGGGGGLVAGAATETLSCPDLKRNLTKGMSGTDVTALQNFLITRTHLEAGNTSGYFGVLTEAAVKQFQCKEMGICSGTPYTTGYGAVGPKTRALIAACAFTGSTSGTSSVSGSSSGATTAYAQASYTSSTSGSTSGSDSIPVDPDPVGDPLPVPASTISLAETTTAAASVSCTLGNLVIPDGAEQAFYSAQTVPAGSSCVSVAQTRSCSNGVLGGSVSHVHERCAVLPSTADASAGETFFDFGGMYGRGAGSEYTNPATNAMSCPSGFTSSPIMGSSGIDYDAYYCYRKHTTGSKSALDFGGTYGFAANDSTYINPATGAGSCPSGYIGRAFVGTAGFDYPGYQCYRYPESNSSHAVHFGGMYGYAAGGIVYKNPATGSDSCPAGYTASAVLGSSGVDYNVYACTNPIVATASCTFNGASVPHGGAVPAFKSSTVSGSAVCEQETRTCSNGTLSGSYAHASCMKTKASSSGGSLSCSVGGVTLASGESKKMYLVTAVPTGDSCEEAGMTQVRTCTNGVLSGSAAYNRSSCTQSAAVAQNRSLLKEFTPYVWATTWYPYFNNTVGVDGDRSVALLGKEIDKIKAQGFNTLWMGGVAIWSQLQPTPGVWNEAKFAQLKAHLDLLRSKNMRVIYQLNYVGEGFAPAGIDGCYWFDSPEQVQKFADFTKELAGRLQEYNSSIYYMVYTEQTRSCLLKRKLAYYYPGFYMKSQADSDRVPATEPYLTYHRQDGAAMNSVLKNSLGTISSKLPKALRNQIFIGMHDPTISAGIVVNDTPFVSPTDFDYFSFPYYPTHADASANSNYQFVESTLNTQLARVKSKVPTTPLMLGEFGWPVWNGSKMVAVQHSDARNVAYLSMIDWSLRNKIGFNAWMWLPRFIDNPEQEHSDYEESLQLTLRDGTLTSTLGVIRQKLLGY